jgi:hypothetical protein
MKQEKKEIPSFSDSLHHGLQYRDFSLRCSAAEHRVKIQLLNILLIVLTRNKKDRKVYSILFFAHTAIE